MNLQLEAGKFYGKTVKQHQVSGFGLSETRYAPHSKLPRHSHESNYFCFVLNGAYTETYGRKIRYCRPSMIVYHPAGELHAQNFDNTAVQLFRVEVNQERLRNLSRVDIGLEYPDCLKGLAIGLAHKLYQEFCEPDVVSHLAIEGLGLELIAAIARHAYRYGKTSRQPPRWLTRARELIRSRFLEQLTLEDIARTVGVHPVTLAREFRRYYDCTVGDMVRRERIGFACRELLQPEEPLNDIAISAGFYDQSHFTKTFKRLIGMTPARYRAAFSSR